MNRCVFVGGLGEKYWISDGKILSRNYPQGCRVYSSHGIATALTSQGVGSVGGYSGLYLVGEDDDMNEKKYRIRRLTPRECWRLMDFTDEQFDKAKSAGLSDTQLYKQAGNSIVVGVVEQIMGNLYDAMPYLFNDLKVSSYFSGIGAFESALDRVYKNKTGDVNNV